MDWSELRNPRLREDVKSIFGTSGNPRTLLAVADRVIQIATTNALTSGTVRSFELNQTHTGIGAIAEALTSIVTTNVACGAWVNSVFARIDFQTAGKVTGLAELFATS